MLVNEMAVPSEIADYLAESNQKLDELRKLVIHYGKKKSETESNPPLED